jgi:hypothetical protein
MYYSCPKDRHLNYNGNVAHGQMGEILRSLSFSPAQVHTHLLLEEARKKNANYTFQLQSKTKLPADIKTKLEKLEDKVMNDVIDAATYKKWKPKLAKDEALLATQINELQKSNNIIIEQLTGRFRN